MLEDLENGDTWLKGGTTLVVGVMQWSTGVLCGLNIGDSFLGIIEPSEGRFYTTRECPILYQKDDGAPKEQPAEDICVTRLHDFTSKSEQERYSKSLLGVSVRPVFEMRDDGILPNFVRRHVCNLAIQGSQETPWMVMVEPSRTIETDPPVEEFDGFDLPVPTEVP